MKLLLIFLFFLSTNLMAQDYMPKNINDKTCFDIKLLEIATISNIQDTLHNNTKFIVNKNVDHNTIYTLCFVRNESNYFDVLFDKEFLGSAFKSFSQKNLFIYGGNLNNKIKFIETKGQIQKVKISDIESIEVYELVSMEKFVLNLEQDSIK